MIRENLENEILQYALEAFKKNIALPVAIEKEAEVAIHDLRADWLLRMRVQETELRFYAEIKTNITKAGRVLIKLQRAQFQFPYPILLVTRYVTAQIAEQLKQDDIQFIDTAGNAYINQPRLYVYVKGNRPPDIVPRLKRAFKPTGLKVVYAFLCNPDLLNKTYREIAQAADVALGTVGWIIRDLKEMGYLLDMAKRGYRLIQKEDLLKRWLIDYHEKLRPKLLLGRFRGPHGWWQQKTLNPKFAQWGGEVAAAKLTKYLKPQNIIIYTTREQLNTVLVENRLKRETDGDIEILEKFWTPLERWQDEDTVHPILVYADLMATGDQRNIETARIIYVQYIIRHIRED